MQFCARAGSILTGVVFVKAHSRGIRFVGLAAGILVLCGILSGCSSGEPVNLKFSFDGLAGEGPARYVELQDNPDDGNTKLLAVGLGEFNFDPDLVEAVYPSISVVDAAGNAYPLQALLYSVALHRFLRWRLPGYQPEVHLGGVLYLFVRGMCGPETPTEDGVPAGVFSWPVPPALVVALSALLGGGAS